MLKNDQGDAYLYDVLEFFESEFVPREHHEVAELFADLADRLAGSFLPRSHESRRSLEHLRDARDCAVRAMQSAARSNAKRSLAVDRHADCADANDDDEDSEVEIVAVHRDGTETVIFTVPDQHGA